MICRNCQNNFETDGTAAAVCPFCQTVQSAAVTGVQPVPRFRDIDETTDDATPDTAVAGAAVNSIPQTAADYARRLEQAAQPGAFVLPPPVSKWRIYRKQLIFYAVSAAVAVVIAVALLTVLCSGNSAPAAKVSCPVLHCDTAGNDAVAKADFNGDTLLHHAVKEHDRDRCLALISAGASADRANCTGVTPMQQLLSEKEFDFDILLILIGGGREVKLRELVGADNAKLVNWRRAWFAAMSKKPGEDKDESELPECPLVSMDMTVTPEILTALTPEIAGEIRKEIKSRFGKERKFDRENFRNTRQWALEVTDFAAWGKLLVFIAGVMISLRIVAKMEALTERKRQLLVIGIIFTGPLFAAGYLFWLIYSKLKAKLSPYLAPETGLLPQWEFFQPEMGKYAALPAETGTLQAGTELLETALRQQAYSLQLSPDAAGYQCKILSSGGKILTQQTLPVESGKNIIALFRKIARMENCSGALQKSYFFVRCGETFIRSALFTASLGELGVRATFYFREWKSEVSTLDDVPLPEILTAAVNTALAGAGGVIAVTGDSDGTFTGLLLKKFAAYGEVIRLGKDLHGTKDGILSLSAGGGADTPAAELLQAMPEYRFAAIDMSWDGTAELPELLQLAATGRVLIFNMKNHETAADAAAFFERSGVGQTVSQLLLAAVTPVRCSTLCRVCAARGQVPAEMNKYQLDTAAVSCRTGCPECGGTGITGSILICRCQRDLQSAVPDDGELAMLILAARGVTDSAEVGEYFAPEEKSNSSVLQTEA